jgi:AcrR family transcriptional regulator
MSTSTGGLRERKKQRTRRAIQTAALELFAAHGFRETTIAQIADAAEVSLRTVTVHFPAKEDLVLSLGSEGLYTMIAAIESRPADQTTFAALRAWIVGQIEDASHPEATGTGRSLLALRHTVIEADPELQARVRGSDAQVERALATGLARDLGVAPDALEPRLAAAAVVAGIRTLTDPVLGGAHPEPQGSSWVLQLIDQVFAFATAGLAALDEPSIRPAPPTSPERWSGPRPAQPRSRR